MYKSEPMGNLRGTYIGIFLISVATLLLEIALTRIFSVSQWYHFAFMIVSIAFLGYGASGTFLSLRRSLLDDINRLLVISSSLFSLSCLLSFIITQRISFDPFRITWDHNQILYITLYYLVLAIPFFLSGICVGAVFAKIPQKIDKLYFFNLTGSGLGCLLVILLFSFFNASEVIAATFLLGMLSVLSFSSTKRGFIFAVMGIVIFLILLPIIYPFLEVNISPYKALNIALSYKDAQLLSTEWNSFSRVDMVKSGAVRYAPGLSYTFRGRLPSQVGVTIDGNSLQGITEYNSLSELEFIDYLPTSLPYRLQNKSRVLIINPGGGLDVLTALYQNASSIQVVEMNPLIVNSVNRRSDLYRNERVRIAIDDGRSFVRMSDERYDIISLSLGGDVITSSTGLYSLSENYLLTTDAFQDYYEHLSEHGILSITRWLQNPPRGDIRVVSLFASAMEKEGIDNYEQNIAVIRTYVTLTVLIKKDGFTEDEIREIKRFCEDRKFDLVYIPGIKESEVNIYNRFPEPLYYKLTRGILFDKDRVYKEYLFDISPVDDEKPFFFNYFRWDKLIPLYESMGRKWEPFFEGGFLAVMILIQAIILSVVLILLPVYSFQRIKRISDKFKIIGYFFLLGMGYMLIEIPLIQKFILFLGQPVYAISIVIFSLLLFSGTGSLISERLKIKKLRHILIALFGMILFYSLTLSIFFHSFLSYNLLSRILISFLVLSPIGTLMGMPFPLGIRAISKELIPWAFCSNACASVIASVLAVVIAISLGFSTVLILAAVSYLVALGIIYRIL